MGLDTSHGCWHGAYSAFTRWRNKIAEVAGYHFLWSSKEYGYQIPSIDWGHLPARCLQGDWTDVPAPSDPLMYLIAHSDCDGEIHPQQGRLLADRLEALIPLLPDEVGGGHIGNWRTQTQKFVDGLRRAAAAGEVVDFH